MDHNKNKVIEESPKGRAATQEGSQLTKHEPKPMWPATDTRTPK